MRRIIVVNTKGGSGKTTVATNLAAAYAARGYATTLLDYDPQGSSMAWLKERPGDAPKITGVATYDSSRPPLSGAWQLQVPRQTERVVVDTQGGIRASDLTGRITESDVLLIPITPSAMDIRASADFIRDLLITARVRYDTGRIGIVANRTRKRSPSLDKLKRFLDTLRIPVVAELRDALPYLDAADQGMGVYELPTDEDHREHQAAWRDLVKWLERDEPERVAQPAQSQANSHETRAPVPSLLKPKPQPIPARRASDRPSQEAEPASVTRVPRFLTKAFTSRAKH